MWAEIATAGGIVGLIGVIVRFQHQRITKLESDTNDRFNKGEEKFHELYEKINDMNTLLVRVDERVLALAKKNGLKC
jgi:hypothetical protein